MCGLEGSEEVFVNAKVTPLTPTLPRQLAEGQRSWGTASLKDGLGNFELIPDWLACGSPYLYFIPFLLRSWKVTMRLHHCVLFVGLPPKNPFWEYLVQGCRTQLL